MEDLKTRLTEAIKHINGEFEALKTTSTSMSPITKAPISELPMIFQKK